MAKNTGFMEYAREDPLKRPVEERINDFREFDGFLSGDKLKNQAARCMDCGIPFCHTFGCPLRNRIPDWNDMVYKGNWRKALDLLHSTDNFPEFTGKICPAPCEAACTLSINQPAVSIRHIELEIVEHGWNEGWIQPEPASFKSGKKIAIIGSGPAGLVTAQKLIRRGHEIVVFEKADRIGGLLRYGIPDFKLEKWVIDRRLEQLIGEGVIFETGVDAGTDMLVKYMLKTFDAIVITAGARIPRDIKIPGKELKGIHYAMDFLTQQNRRNAGDIVPADDEINARDKFVVVVGGGDTGSDCIGTSRRQGAKEITQIEILPRPPEERSSNNPWPTWPRTMRTSSSQEEGCNRLWSIKTNEFASDNNSVKTLRCISVNWNKHTNSQFEEISGSEFELKADLVLLAMGFIHVEHGPLVQDLGLAIDSRGNISVDANLMASVPGVFAAGDCAMGASLVVSAMAQGHRVADSVDRYLSTSK